MTLQGVITPASFVPPIVRRQSCRYGHTLVSSLLAQQAVWLGFSSGTWTYSTYIVTNTIPTLLGPQMLRPTRRDSGVNQAPLSMPSMTYQSGVRWHRRSSTALNQAVYFILARLPLQQLDYQQEAKRMTAKTY